jgi:hypothetical protein
MFGLAMIQQLLQAPSGYSMLDTRVSCMGVHQPGGIERLCQPGASHAPHSAAHQGLHHEGFGDLQALLLCSIRTLAPS